MVLLVATPLVAAAACSTAPRPPASDTTGNLIYDIDDAIATVWFVWAVANCLSQPSGCNPSLGIQF